MVRSSAKSKPVHQHLAPFYMGVNGKTVTCGKKKKKRVMPVHPVACLLKSTYEIRTIQGREKEQKKLRITKEKLRGQLATRMKKVARKVGKGKRKVAVLKTSTMRDKSAPSTERPTTTSSAIDDDIHRCLLRLSHCCTAQFYYLSCYQRDFVSGQYSPRHDDDPLREPARLTKYQRRLYGYHMACLDLMRKSSLIVHRKLDGASKETNQFLSDEYLTCRDCTSLYHKSYQELYLPNYTSLIGPIYEKDVGPTHICFVCYVERCRGRKKIQEGRTDSCSPNSDTTGNAPGDVSLGSSHVGNDAEPTTRTNKSKNKSNKRRGKKTERQDPGLDVTMIYPGDGSSTASTTRRTEKEDGPPQQPLAAAAAAKEDGRPSSPTDVILTNDDWVDFLLKSGSIIALNAYMDAVLGTEESLLSQPGDE